MQHQSLISILLASAIFLGASSCAVQKIDGIKRYGNPQFAKRLQSDKYILLDVRTPHEYDSAHIPNAVLLNIKDTAAFANGLATLDPKKKYLLVCRTGKRSMDAARQMRARGIRKVGDLEKGMSKWDGVKVEGK